MNATTTEETTEITTEAIHLLFREMGVAKTLRFLSQMSAGRGNYTEERHERLAGITVADIVAEIEKSKSDRAENL